MHAHRSLFSLAALGLFCVIPELWAQMPRTPSEPNAQVYFIQPKNSAVITGSVKVVMGLVGMGIAPAGVGSPATGHHHLIIDAPLPAFNIGLPMDDNHHHFGKGQTEAMLQLLPGQHTLQLVLADKNHVPHDPAVISEVISITVQ